VLYHRSRARLDVLDDAGLHQLVPQLRFQKGAQCLFAEFLEKSDHPLPGSERAAHYACHAALADPTGEIVAVAAGSCGGLIAEQPAGCGGFGYDPLFIVPEYHRTFGELPAAVKAVISHRARALRAILPALVRALPGAAAPAAAARGGG
jgi:non-canonical purine NTP pyrophosphatase (RdgB/HAM1 family)